jgi:hypothetical protein
MKAIHDLVRLIAAEQQADGSFLSYTSPDASGQAEGAAYHTTFVTSQILSAIASCEGEAVSRITLHASRFIREQFQDGSVNYWQRNSSESASMRLPDDMDDSACALAALLSVDPTMRTDGALLGGFTRALVDTERETGGPYFTWRIGPKADPKWKDVDVAVNANIAYALELVDVQLENLNHFLDEMVEREAFRSPYYPDSLAIVYFLSRLKRPAWAPKLHQTLETLRGADGTWGSGLRDALAVSSFLRTDGVSHVSQIMLERLGDTGTLRASAFCLDPMRDGVTYFAGSRALDAAFRIEAFTLASRKTQNAKPEMERVPQPDELERHQLIMQETRRLLPEGLLGGEMEKLLRRIESFDAGKNITLTPWRFALALGEPTDEVLLRQLGVANVLGWAAYTAYDDVLDGDAGGELVSPANAFLRRLSDVLTDVLPENESFQAWWRQVMDRVDEANAWELAFCRFAFDGILPKPDLSIADELFFSERSLGHAIGPVAIMLQHGFELDSFETENVLELYRCYLTARQMHDDAHDWQEDFKKGQLNSASLRLLAKTSAQNFDELRIEFWTKGILEHSEALNEVCHRGHEAIASCEAFETGEGLHRLFERIEAGTKDALAGRERTLAFLTSFRPA